MVGRPRSHGFSEGLYGDRTQHQGADSSQQNTSARTQRGAGPKAQANSRSNDGGKSSYQSNSGSRDDSSSKSGQRRKHARDSSEGARDTESAPPKKVPTVCDGCGIIGHKRMECGYSEHPLFVHQPDTWEGSTSQMIMQKIANKGKVTYNGEPIRARLYRSIVSERGADEMGEVDLKRLYASQNGYERPDLSFACVICALNNQPLPVRHTLQAQSSAEGMHARMFATAFIDTGALQENYMSAELASMVVAAGGTSINTDRARGHQVCSAFNACRLPLGSVDLCIYFPHNISNDTGRILTL